MMACRGIQTTAVAIHAVGSATYRQFTEVLGAQLHWNISRHSVGFQV